MKQETLEEATTKYLRTLKGVNYRSIYDFSNQQTLAFMYGAKWQQERSYSEEEVNKMFDTLKINSVDNVATIHNVELFISSWKRELKKK